MKKKKMSGGKMMAVGAGVAAAGAGAYYLFGPHKKAHQKKAKILMAKIEKEVKQKVAKAKSMTKPIYHSVIDSLVVAYTKQHKMHEGEIKAFAKKLKGKWTHVAKVANKKAKKSVRGVKRKLNKRR